MIVAGTVARKSYSQAAGLTFGDSKRLGEAIVRAEGSLPREAQTAIWLAQFLLSW